MWFEKFSLFMNGYTAGLLTALAIQWFNFKKLKKKVESQAPPEPKGGKHPVEKLFESLRAQGLPFEVIAQQCPCPVCTARRESEKTQAGSDDRVLH